MKRFKIRLILNLILSLLLAGIITLTAYIISTYVNFFGTLQKPTQYIFLGVIFVLALLISFANMLNYSLSYINRLSSTLNTIAKGNFDIAIPIEQDDEFGYIARHINRMARELKAAKEKEDNSIHKERLQHLARHEEEKKTHDLITNVAHDLKTPLTSMMGYLQLLNDHPELEEDKRIKYTKIAYEKCGRLHRLINDLFNYSAFSSQQVQYHPTKINISELVWQISDEYYTELENQQLHLETSIANPTIFVNADGELMARVFDNLIGNAIKYNENGHEIKLASEEDDNTVTIKISNQSSAMSREELDHIFEKFYRSDTSRSSHTGGTGLGLAIAKSIVEMHNGEIFATHRHGWMNFFVVLKKYPEND